MDLTSKITADTYKKKVKEILSKKHIIQNESWIAIDPGSISLGYCLVDKGKIVKKGSLVSTSKGIGERLNDLFDLLQPLIDSPKLMIVEMLRTSTGHLYVTWSAGMSVAALKPEIIIEIPTNLWKKCTDTEYYKSDVMDALYMAKFVLQICEENNVDT